MIGNIVGEIRQTFGDLGKDLCTWKRVKFPQPYQLSVKGSIDYKSL